MKNILVTGGFGFIGGHLIERLLADSDNHVYVVDDLSSCPIPYKELLDELHYPDNLAWVIKSISRYISVCDEIGGNVPYNEIYHLASPVGPAGVLKHAGKMIEMVVGDIYHLMQLALHDDAKLVDVSTSEVYGGGQDGMCREDMDKIIQAETTVRLEYAIAKLAAETAIINTCKVSKLKASIVRPFNVAGPRQSSDGGFVLPRFIEQAMNGEMLTVFGDGTQKRAFTHVEDIVDGLIRVMANGKNAEVYNLGNNLNVTTINDLAARVNHEVGRNINRIVRMDGKTVYGELYAEAADKYPDATKAMDELGWSPKFGIDATIRDAYGYVALRVNSVVEEEED